MTGPSPAADPGSDGAEPVGSMAEEAVKLLRALSGAPHQPDAGAWSATDHTCSSSWCPVCRVAGVVRDHPEAVASVTQSASALARSLRDLAEAALAPQEKTQ